MKKKTWSIMMVAVILLLVVAVGALGARRRGSGPGRGVTEDPEAQAGVLTDLNNPEEVEAVLQSNADATAFRVLLNTHPLFESGDSEGTLLIQNDPGNAYNMQVEIILNSTGETLYTSPVLAPGESELYGRLTRALETGEHSATAYIRALESGTGKNVAQVISAITITVGQQTTGKEVM